MLLTCAIRRPSDEVGDIFSWHLRQKMINLPRYMRLCRYAPRGWRNVADKSALPTGPGRAEMPLGAVTK